MYVQKGKCTLHLKSIKIIFINHAYWEQKINVKKRIFFLHRFYHLFLFLFIITSTSWHQFQIFKIFSVKKQKYYNSKDIFLTGASTEVIIVQVDKTCYAWCAMQVVIKQCIKRHAVVVGSRSAVLSWRTLFKIHLKRCLKWNSNLFFSRPVNEITHNRKK